MFKILFQSLANSFDMSDKGASSKKLSAFAAVVLSVCLSIKNCTPEVLEDVLIVWLSFAGVCLGLVTFEKTRFTREKNGEVLRGESESQG